MKHDAANDLPKHDAANDLPKHDEISWTDKACECRHCGETIEKVRFIELDETVAQHITYTCEEVGVVRMMAEHEEN